MASDNLECACCLNNLNYKNVVTCLQCESSFCKKCVQTYITTNSAIQCMKCGKEWDRDFLFERMPRTVVDTLLKTVQGDIILDKEKYLLQETQETILKTKQFFISKITEEEERIEKRKNTISKIKSIISGSSDIVSPVQNFSKCADELSDSQSFNSVMGNIRLFYEECIIPSSFNSKVPRETVKRVQLYPCPKSNCRGFLSPRYLSHLWKCGICDSSVCSKCREIVPIEETSHQCKQETLETVKFIDKTSKKCPKCGVYITRIEGCNNMFCTSCNTGFRWDTFKIINQTNDNPHYLEWLKNNTSQGNQEQTRNCENDWNRIYSQIDNRVWHPSDTKWGKRDVSFYSDVSYNLSIQLREIYRLSNHIRNNVVMENNSFEEEHKCLRVKYLLNKITEQEWKTILYRSIKKTEKNKRLNNVYEMFADGSRYIFLNSLAFKSRPFLTLMMDCDKQFKHLSMIYKSVRKYIQPELGKNLLWSRICETTIEIESIYEKWGYSNNIDDILSEFKKDVKEFVEVYDFYKIKDKLCSPKENLEDAIDNLTTLAIKKEKDKAYSFPGFWIKYFFED